MNLILKPENEEFQWALHGLYPPLGWLDLDVYDEDGKIIDRLHVYAKKYLRAGLPFLKKDPGLSIYTRKVQEYLKQNSIHFWYDYDALNEEEIFEVDYEAPINKDGLKPKSIEIWHPDEEITKETLASIAERFCHQFLKTDLKKAEIIGQLSYAEAVENMSKKTTTVNNQYNIEITPKHIHKLAALWKIR